MQMADSSCKVMLFFSDGEFTVHNLRTLDVPIRNLVFVLPPQVDAGAICFIPMFGHETVDEVQHRKPESMHATIRSVFPDGFATFYVVSLTSTVARSSITAGPSLLKTPLAEVLNGIEGFAPREPVLTPRCATILGTHEGVITFRDANYCDVFPFVNREKECEALLHTFCDMESRRNNEVFDATMPKISFPVCAGLPGIGKTRFARIGVANLVAKVPEEEKLDALMKRVNSLGCLPPDRVETFCREILLAYDGRNLRIASDEGPFSMLPIEQAAAVELVLQAWCHRNPRKPEHDMRRALVRTMGSSYTLRDAIEYITDGRPTERAVIVNIDEAHRMNDLPVLLNAFAMLIIVLKYKVYVSVTGVKPEVIQNDFDRSHVAANTIHLPLLPTNHVVDILKHLFKVQKVPLPLKTAVWWLGGVPRYLQYFVECAAVKFRCATHDALGVALMTHNANDLMDVIQSVCSTINLDRYPAPFYENVLAVCVAEAKLNRTSNLCPEAPLEGRTASWAEAQGILYLEPSTTVGLWTVRVPPLVLYQLQRAYGSSKTLARVVCLDLHVHLTPDDSEAYTLSVLLLKLRAFYILGEKEVSLQSLCDGFPNVMVKVPSVHTYDVLRSRLEDPEALREEILKRRHPPYDGPVGFINGKSASAYLVLDNTTVVIQEKQHTNPRKQILDDKLPDGHSSAGAIDNEMAHAHSGHFRSCFLYVSDTLALDEADVVADCPVIAEKADIAAQLGSFVAELHAYHWEGIV